MRASEYEVVIIGGGVMGLSTAIEAAQELPGKVACLDARGFTDAVRANSDCLQPFCLSAFEHTSYVPLLAEALEAWKNLGEDIYVQTGGLYTGPPDCALVTGSLESALTHDSEYVLLSSNEVSNRYPQLSLPKEYVGFMEANGGFIRSAKAIKALTNRAKRLGVDLLHESAFSISPLSHRWMVRCQSTVFLCKQLIVACGVATPTLVPSLKPFIRPREHLLAWFDSPDLHHSPSFLIMNDQEEIVSGFPPVDNFPGSQFSAHHRFMASSMSEQEARLTELARFFLPDLSDNIQLRRKREYDLSRDGHFVIGRLEPGLTVACGLGSYGFKFGSMIGRMVMEAAWTEFSDENSLFDVNRFTSTSGLT